MEGTFIETITSESHLEEESKDKAKKVDSQNTESISTVDENHLTEISTSNNESSKSKDNRNCNNVLCKEHNTREMITCGRCKTKRHYRCTNLPAYQLSLFLTKTYKKKYICEACVDTDDQLENLCSSDVNSQTDLARIQSELWSKCDIIGSMEKSQTTLCDLIEDKDELIATQKTIIKGLISERDTNIVKLEEAENIITLKDAELIQCQSKLSCLAENTTAADQSNVYQVEVERKKNENLDRKLQDQILITQKYELAFNTQEKLVISKNELIENLKEIIAQKNNMSRCRNNEDNLTSRAINEDSENNGKLVELENTESESIPGFQECIVSLKSISLHGVALNGFLVWADIQRRTKPENLWREEALKHFTDEEISDAKILLWEICDEAHIGRKINRQGSSKTTSELNDISNALNNLAEKKISPLFIGSSSMIMQNPPSFVTGEKVITEVIKNSVHRLEESLDEQIKKQNELINKNHDRVISKTVVGNKKIEEITKRLEFLEKQTKAPVNNIPQAFQLEMDGHIPNNPRYNDIMNTRGAAPPNDPTPQVTQRVGDTFMNHGGSPNDNNIYLQNEDRCDANHEPPSHVPQEDTWATMARRNANKNPTREKFSERTGWKQRLHLLHGTAGEDEQGGSFSADVDIVAYNVAKNVTSVNLCNRLTQNGLRVNDCRLLTTSPSARSLSYRITIHPKDYEKATKDESLWPYRVGVRLFKHFNNNNNSNLSYKGNREPNERRVGFQDGYPDRNSEYRYSRTIQ